MNTNISCSRMLGLTALLALQACGDPKSSSTGGPDGGPVPTSRMTIDLIVESTDLRTAVVRANLNDGRVAGSSYRLDGGDFFRACVAGVCRTMADNDSVTSPDYIARFDYLSNVDYVVSFNRQEDRNAPDTRVALPPTFSFVTPVSRQQFTDGETVQVEWTPTGAPARATLAYEADCTHVSGPDSFSVGTLSTDTNADGRESFRVDEIVSFAATNSASRITRCSIDLIVRHELQGRIDPAFNRGTARGIVSRELNVEYIAR